MLPGLRHVIPVAAQLVFLYTVIVACACFDQFFSPSRLAILGSIVLAEQQPAASGQLSASAAIAQVIGPPIAAPLLFTVGVQWALIVNAASFGVSFVCIRAIRLHQGDSPATPAARTGYLAELRDGLRYFARSRVLVALGAGLAIALMGNGAVNSLAPFFVPHNLHVAASRLGFLVSAVGVGAVAGSMFTGQVSRWLAAGQIFWISLTGAGITLITLSRSTALAPAIVLAVILGLFAGMLNSVSYPIILSVTPSEFLGRVSSVLNPIMELSSMTGIVLAGALASTALRGFHETIAGITFGPYDTVLGLGGLLFVLGGIAAMPPMRRPQAGRGEPRLMAR